MSIGPILALAAGGMLTGILAGGRAPRLWRAGVGLGTGLALAASGIVLGTGETWEWEWPWAAEGAGAPFLPGGEAVRMRLDPLGAWFLALLSVVGGAGAVYATEYWRDAEHPRSARSGRVWWAVLLLGLGLVLVAAHGLHFLLGWELFTLAAFFLMTLDGRTRAVRAAGWLYLGASHVAVLCLFAFFALLAARTGTWGLGPVNGRPELASLFWLALGGFGLKAGMFPLHVWLPAAHANAPSHVSAMLSGVTLKMGVYGLVRFTGWLPVPGAAGWIVVGLGLASAVLGVAFALGQHDLKRLLAYHSVENIGIILVGLGFALVAAGEGDAAWGRLALAGGLLHVWNHGLFKALLFLGAGSVLHATGTREMSRLGGLWRTMPWTASLFGLGAAAIAGLPPLNGFVSEWLIGLGLFDAALGRGPGAWMAMPSAVLLGMTGALALACFVKVCGVVFLGAPRSREAGRARECGPAMRAAMTGLASACVGIGLFPVLVWPALARVAGAWRPAWPAESPAAAPLGTLGMVHAGLAGLGILAGAGLWAWVRRGRFRLGATWDCGYAAPTVRMQSTAGSMAAILTEWFAWILRPVWRGERVDGWFPPRASWSRRTPETVLERVVEPAGGWVLELARVTRRLQHGRVQSYLLYLLLGLAGVSMMVLLGRA